MAARLDDFAQLRVDILDGVRSVYNLANVRGNAKNGITRSQALRQATLTVGNS
jgi:hypothetical protein